MGQIHEIRTEVKKLHMNLKELKQLKEDVSEYKTFKKMLLCNKDEYKFDG